MRGGKTNCRGGEGCVDEDDEDEDEDVVGEVATWVYSLATENRKATFLEEIGTNRIRTLFTSSFIHPFLWTLVGDILHHTVIIS